jgi:hypothetical protein
MVTLCANNFNIQKLYFLPTECIYVFCADRRKSSDYFSIKYELIGFYSRNGVFSAR